MGEPDYYAVLGVTGNASTSEIKSAYRSLAKAMHPDAGGTAETFQVLREAYETLVDPVRRSAYVPPDYTPHPRREAQRTTLRRRPQGYYSRRRTVFGDAPHYVAGIPRLRPESIPWWDAVDPTQRVNYAPKSATGHALFVVTAAGLLLLLVPVIVPTARSAWWLALVAVPVGVAVWLGRYQVQTVRIERELSADFGTEVIFGRPGGDPDQLGEQLTAELLARYFTRLPGARIFHSLAWPGSVFADVDHAVLAGNRLILIESKLWPPGHYSLDPSGELCRNEGRFRGGSSQLAGAIAAYQDLLPGLTVRGALVIYPNRPGEVSTTYTPEVASSPMTAEDLVIRVGDWLASQPPTVDKAVFRAILDLVVSR